MTFSQNWILFANFKGHKLDVGAYLFLQYNHNSVYLEDKNMGIEWYFMLWANTFTAKAVMFGSCFHIKRSD